MKKSIVFMFSGQGAQYYHMGKELFEQNEIFRRWMFKLDNYVQSIIDESILEILYDKEKRKGETFQRTLYTHPAIFMLEYSLAQSLLENGVMPRFLLGSSLGEYVSLAIADVMSYKEILKCLIKQAKLFEAYCPKGGMIAVIHDWSLYQQIPILSKNSQLVSVNYKSHFVISGENNRLDEIDSYLKSKGILHQRLPVSFGFHSFAINSIGEMYKSFLASKNYGTPKIKLVSCLEGKSLSKIDPHYLWDVVRKPIDFPKALRWLEFNGDNVYIDLGPAGTLANFAKYNLGKNSDSEILNIITPFANDLKNLNKVIDCLSTNIYKKKREEKNMVAYVFPGQGSQKKGMGEVLFDEFKELTRKADKILGYSVKELCLEDPHNLLGQTQYTQPALYVVNALSYLKKIKETGIKPSYVGGHSLGEYNALLASGVFDFETGLMLVKKRGELMSKASGGGMAAVIGLNGKDIKAILEDGGFKDIDIANYNTPSQIVISGPKSSIQAAKSTFQSSGVMNYIILNVSGAFHSRYMAESQSKFKQYLNQFKFNEPNIPVISNVYARPYKKQHLKNTLADQITKSVKWTESIRYLMGKGDMDIIQIGPGNSLTSMVRAIKRQAEPLIVEDEENEYNPKDCRPSEKDLRNNMEYKETFTPDYRAINKSKQVEGLTANSLGDEEFKRDYNLKYAYLSGSMYRGISSKEMVVRMGKSGFMSFLGTGGLELDEIEDAICYIKKELNKEQPYGINLLHSPGNLKKEEDMVDLFIKHHVTTIEASAYMSITSSLVRYRLKGIKRNPSGKVIAPNKIIAKVSRPEVAEAFMSPIPQRIVKKLLAENKITTEEAELSCQIPVGEVICVEADSAGHTDQGVAYVLIPAMLKLRDNLMKKYGYSKKIKVGTAGGIGTPEAAASAFMLGVDFILTGSINQCTVEAGTSNAVKDLLQQINVQDTEYAPAGDMFELGAKVQVLKRGVFFPARANKLHELYRQYDSIDKIDEKRKKQIQEKYFKKSFEEVYDEVKSFYSPLEIEKAERNSKHKMALIFKWYFGYSTRIALDGTPNCRVDYQVHCGPALGAFNQWVKGTPLEDWRNRHVNEIAIKIMDETAKLLNNRFYKMMA